LRINRNKQTQIKHHITTNKITNIQAANPIIIQKDSHQRNHHLNIKKKKIQQPIKQNLQKSNNNLPKNSSKKSIRKNKNIANPLQQYMFLHIK